MMLSINDALTQVLNHSNSVTETELIDIEKALGRILAQNQISSINVPPADNSAMDGYAINTENLSELTQTILPVSQTIAAGSSPLPLAPNSAARIFTGAEIPSGANAVVMQEQCETHKQGVVIPPAIEKNNNIRPQGQDIKVGDIILQKGRCLKAQDIGLLASVGLPTTSVFRRLSVAILSTGDELVEPGKPLASGKIYNSNRYLLKSFLNNLNINIIDLGVVKDTLAATKSSLEKAAHADCIISTGGVSVGDEDHIKQAVTELGSLNVWRIALKPGKPLAFGYVNNTPFFGLPGNPVSTFVTFLLFVRPFLLTQQGQTYQSPTTQTVKANFHCKANPKRQEYLRVKLTGNIAESFPNQSSGVLSSIVQADGLAIVPIGELITPGDPIEYIPFSQFL